MGRTENGRMLLVLMVLAMACLAGCNSGDDGAGADEPGSEETGSTDVAESVELNLTSVARGTVVPGEERRVKTPDGRLEVVVPAGAFEAEDEVEISRVQGALPALSESFEPVAVFDVSAGEQHTFRKPLEITLSYADMDMPPDAAPHKLRAAWWHEDSQRWISMPVSVDAEARSVTIETPHLTVLGWFMEKGGYERRVLGEFELIWDENVLKPPKDKTNASAWKGKIMYSSSNDADRYVTASDAPYLQDKTLPPLIRDAAAYLTYAQAQYKKAGWKMPDTPISVVVETTLTSENARDKALGVIHIGEYNTSSSQLKTSMAHELFHAVQNEYLWSVGGMTFLGWFCESTAEYAGSIVWGAKAPSRRVPPKYFSERLDAEKHEHEYHSAHFIHHLVGDGSTTERLKRLKGLWTGTLANHGLADATDVLHPMHMFLSANGSGLKQEFREHVYAVCLGEHSPMKGGSSASRPPADMAEGWALLKADEKTAPGLNMTLKGGHRAKVWAVRAAMKEKEKFRPVKLTVGGLSRALTASLHILPGGNRSNRAVQPVQFITPGEPEAKVSLGEDDAAYVVIINDGTSTASLSLEVEEGEATPLDALHRTTSVSVTLSATHPNGYKEKRRVSCENLRWQGTAFTGQLKDQDQGYKKVEETDVRVSGRVSPDGGRLVSIAFNKKLERTTETPHKGDVKTTYDTDLTLSGVPLGSSNTGDRPYFRYKLDAPIDPNHLSYKQTITDSDGTLESDLPDVFLQSGDLVVHFGTY